MTATRTLDLQPLSDSVGAQVLDVDVERMREDDDLPMLVSRALDEFGVLLLRGLNIDDITQLVFSRKFGTPRSFENNPIPELFEVSWNKENAYGDYLRGNVSWHFDGVLDQDIPTKLTMLSAKVVSTEGGQTEFASSYRAYDLMTDAEREQLGDARVLFSFEASQRRVFDDPSDELVAEWRARPTREHPLVWTHENGRKSLVIGSTMDHIVGMDRDEGRAILEDLLARATAPQYVYSHTWEVGDTVVWDNGGLFHRAMPFDPASRRRMHRSTIMGTEAIG